MTLIDVIALIPLAVVAVTAVIAVLVIAFYRNHLLTVSLTLAGLALAFATLIVVASESPRQITALLVVDGYALFFMGLLFSACFVVAILSYAYLEGQTGEREEYYVLLLLATLGSAILVASRHFVSFFVGLEILSVSLYALIAYPKRRRSNIEAAVKYLILAGVTAASLLFGMALIYAELGTMAFPEIARAVASAGRLNAVMLVGLGMLTVGVGFKLALVPFHMWTPDVYQGAPAPVTGFIATVSKGGMLALLVRYFTEIPIYQYSALVWTFTAIAVASMLLGNLMALLQDNVKRVLAYSSIAHLGYLMVPFLASGLLAKPSIAFYLVAYFVTTLSAFGVVTVLSRPGEEAEELRHYRGLFFRRPWLAALFGVSLLSLAGIPPTAGLVAKIYITAAGVQSALWLLLFVLVAASVIGVFYYMRIFIALVRRPEEEVGVAPPDLSLSRADGWVLSLLAFLLIGLGLYPTPVLRVVSDMVLRLMS